MLDAAGHGTQSRVSTDGLLHGRLRRRIGKCAGGVSKHACALVLFSSNRSMETLADQERARSRTFAEHFRQYALHGACPGTRTAGDFEGISPDATHERQTNKSAKRVCESCVCLFDFVYECEYLCLCLCACIFVCVCLYV